MRQHLRLTIGLFAAFGIAWHFGIQADAKDREDVMCQYGTSVRFEKNPSEAARKALKEEKLVMVLHVSGEFENPEFT